ncbi:MAG: hypothetical protein IJ842_06315 [Bacilli bacterium]|nr:hypothetical protein [Bacilli bacterium]
MLNEYLQNDLVINFITNLKINERYNEKNKIDNYLFYTSNEMALHIFYDALFKYKIIIDDFSYFEDFMIQVEKIFKNINNYTDIEVGINKLIGKIVCQILNVKDYEDHDNIMKVGKYIYDKYIDDGYYIHGFNKHYLNIIKENGFITEIYDNYYDRFIEFQKILDKYNTNIVLDKDFSSKEVFFTDSFILGSYYSLYSPLFYSKLFLEKAFSKRIQEDDYLKGNYSVLKSHLKRFMDYYMFNEDDKKFVYELFLDQWNLLHSEGSSICLLVVPRKLIDSDMDKLSFENFVNTDLFEMVDDLLTGVKNNIKYEGTIDIQSFEIVELDSFYYYNSNLVSDKKEIKKEDSLGGVYVLTFIGSILISLGVVLSILLLWR